MSVMPITDIEKKGAPIDEAREIARLTPSAGSRVSLSWHNADDPVTIELQMRQKEGDWHTRVEFPRSKKYEDTVTVSAGEVRLYVSKGADLDGATADFYFAAGR